MKPEIDYTLYLVTDRALMSAPSLEEAVRSAVAGGCTVVQLREKAIDSPAFLALARSVKSLTDELHVPLIINDRVDVALAVRAAGVHVGQSDVPAERVRALIGADRVLGVSVSTLGEARAALAAGADYLGVGAMFPTDTKADATAVSLHEFAAIRAAAPLPVVAIGGVSERTAPVLGRAGADGVAAVSAILSAPDIAAAAARLKNAFLAGKAARA